MSKKIGLYELIDDELTTVLSDKSIKKAFVQLPEGLQQYTQKIKVWLEETFQLKVIFDAQSNYGACDIPLNSTLRSIGVDLLIQIGHLPIPSMNENQYTIPIIFVNARSTIPVRPVIEKSLSKIMGKHIGIVTTAQHIHLRKQMKTILEENGFTVCIGKGDNRIFSSGQVLGCNFSAADQISDEIDSFLFVGSGFFHPLGLLLATDKPVIVADPYANKVIDSTEIHERKQQILRQRYGAITFAKQAKMIGVIIGLKPGQIRTDLAIKLQKKIKKHGKQSILLTTGMIHADVSDRFPFIDVFVSTACPRIAIDDYASYKKPILTPVELEIALNEKEWDDYRFDEIH